MLPAEEENRNKALTSVLRMSQMFSGHVIVKRLHVRKTVFRMRKNYTDQPTWATLRVWFQLNAHICAYWTLH